jgi:hypothetical protein
MSNRQNNLNQLTPRENFLMSLLNKVTKEYQALLEYTRRVKPLKIVDILELSSVPGETKFAIQITNKNAIVKLKAEEIILGGFKLDQFSDFHAEMIRQALFGKLTEFLKLPIPNPPAYKIMSKKWEQRNQETIFVVGEAKDDGTQFALTANALNGHKEILLNMDQQDIFDVGYTLGSESVIKEKLEIQRVKND